MSSVSQKIYSVIATYNGQQYIEKCIESLLKSTVVVNIIIVDNNSKDETKNIIKKRFPGIVLIELNQNIGFGNATNIGIRYAFERGAENVLLINQDAWVYQETIEKLVKLQRSYAQYGILSPIQLNGSESSLDTHFGQFVGRSVNIVELLSDKLLNLPLKDLYDVDFVNAAIWLISRKCIKKIGLFNPSFYHYGEDVDYAQRLKYFKLKIGICPEVYAVHERIQHSITEQQPIDKKIGKIKAEIVYRLSRINPKTTFNLISVISLILFAPNGQRLTVKLKFYMQLFWFTFTNFNSITKNRKIAKTGKYCFFI